MSCLSKMKEKYPELKEGEVKRLAEVIDSYKSLYDGETIELKRLMLSAVNEEHTRALAVQRGKVNDIAKKVNLLHHTLQPNFHGNSVEGLLSIFEGTTRNVANKYFNLDNVYQQNRTKYANMFLMTLRDENLLKFAADPKNNDILIDLYERYDKSFAKSDNPLERVAHHVKSMNAVLLKLQQDAGSTITGNDRYLFAQTHNHDLILSDPAKWVEFTADKIDPVKSFGHGEWTPEQVKRALTEMANNLEDFGGWGEGHFMGGKRELYFLDGKFKEYNSEYGYRTFKEGIVNSIDVAAKKASIHEVLGSNPEKNLNDLIAQVKNVRKGDPSLSETRLRKVQNALDLYKGKGFRAGYGLNPKIYGFVKGVKSLETMAILGRSGITAINDYANVTVRQKLYSGKSLPVAMFDTVVNAIATVPPSQKDYFSKLLQVGLSEQPKELFEFLGYNPRSTMLSRMTHKFMILNGLDAMTSSTRKTAARVHAHDLTKTIMKDKKWNVFQEQTIKAIGLSETDVANLRILGANGDLITPDLVSVNGAEAGLKIEGGKEAYLKKLENKLASFYTDAVNSSSPKMGAKEQRWLNRHLPTNDPARLTMEVIGFLQSTILKITNTQAELMRASNPQGELVNFSSARMLAGTMTLMGTWKFIVDALKDQITHGEVDLGDDEKVRTRYVEALLTSGAAGIGVDAMVQMANPFRGNQSGARMPSPILDHLSDVVKLGGDVLKDDGGRAEKRLQRLIRRTIPGQNMWFIDNEIRRNMIHLPLVDK